MSFRIPSSPRKRYLNGIDWVIHTLHVLSVRRTGVGNYSQVVLDLDEAPDEDRLRDRLRVFFDNYPLINGRVARDWNLAPYWRMPDAVRSSPRLDRMVLPNGAIEYPPRAELAGPLNKPLAGARDYLAFSLVEHPSGGCCLALTFDHRLIDAAGAETLLEALGRFCEGAEPPAVPVTEPARLGDWRARFQAGQRANRALVRLAHTAPTVLPQAKGEGGTSFCFRLRALTADQGRAVVQQAYATAGYLMLLPYTLAATVLVFHRLARRRGLRAGDYVVPVSVEHQAAQGADNGFFFNHISFLFFDMPAALTRDPDRLVAHVRGQMYEQLHEHLPRDLEEASLLMRIAPPRLLGRLMDLPMKGELASFCFAYLARSRFALETFCGARVRNLFHMPRVPPAPGLGFFFSTWGDRLNITVSALEELLSEEEMDESLDSLETLLLNGLDATKERKPGA